MPKRSCIDEFIKWFKGEPALGEIFIINGQPRKVVSIARNSFEWIDLDWSEVPEGVGVL